MMPAEPRSRGPRSAASRERERRARRARVRRKRVGIAVAAIVLVVLLVVLIAGGGGGPRSGSAIATVARAGAHARGTRASNTATGAAGTSEAEENPEVRRLIALGKPIYCAAPRGDEVALTFDDGPGPYTKLMLAKLRKHGVHATFFIVGRNIPLVPGATSAERAIGAVGDHTFTHPELTALPIAEAEQQIVRTQEAVARSSGGPVFLFRPPYGAHNAQIDGVVREHGLLEILWDVDSQDSLGASYAGIERNVIGGLRPGSIILMHENHGQTVRAMLSIFAALQRKHLRAVSVPRLLRDDPPSTAQVLAGGAGCGLGGNGALGGG